MKIKILIADDHAVLRTGLKLMLSAQPDLEVVGEASDGVKAVSEAQRLNPDVVLMDLAMGARSGVPAIGEIISACPSTKVLVLTMHGDPAYVRTAFAAGATGYVIKNSDDTELVRAIRDVTAGKRFVDRSFDEASVLDAQVQRRSRANGGSRSMELLSAREREVFTRVARGFTNQQIADQLRLSVKSVETYRARFMEKLELRSRAELVRYALDCGVLASGE